MQRLRYTRVYRYRGWDIQEYTEYTVAGAEIQEYTAYTIAGARIYKSIQSIQLQGLGYTRIYSCRGWDIQEYTVAGAGIYKSIQLQGLGYTRVYSCRGWDIQEYTLRAIIE